MYDHIDNFCTKDATLISVAYILMLLKYSRYGIETKFTLSLNGTFQG